MCFDSVMFRSSLELSLSFLKISLLFFFFFFFTRPPCPAKHLFIFFRLTTSVSSVSYQQSISFSVGLPHSSLKIHSCAHCSKRKLLVKSKSGILVSCKISGSVQKHGSVQMSFCSSKSWVWWLNHQQNRDRWVLPVTGHKMGFPFFLSSSKSSWFTANAMVSTGALTQIQL